MADHDSQNSKPRASATDETDTPTAGPDGASAVDDIFDEIKDHFEGARERLSASSSALKSWIETTKVRFEDEIQEKREAAEAALAEATAPLHPRPAGASSADLRAAIEHLDEADSQAELLSRLLEQGCKFAGRAMLLLGSDPAEGQSDSAEDSRLRVWNAIGFGDELVGQTLPCPDAWTNVLSAEETLTASGDDAGILAQALECERPSRSVAVPFILRDSAYAVFYADDLPSAAKADTETAGEAAESESSSTLDVDALQILNFVASQSMECLTLRSVRPSATLQGVTLVATADDDEASEEPSDHSSDTDHEAAESEPETAVPEDEGTPGLGATGAVVATGAIVATGAVVATGAAAAAAVSGAVGASGASDPVADDLNLQVDVETDPYEDTDHASSEDDTATDSASGFVFADRLETPTHYESSPEEDNAEVDADTPEAPSQPSESDLDLDRTHMLSTPATEVEPPPPPAAPPTPPAATPQPGGWSLTPEQGDETPAQGFRPSDDLLAAAPAEESSEEAVAEPLSPAPAPPPSFVSVIEESGPQEPLTPPSPFATQVVSDLPSPPQVVSEPVDETQPIPSATPIEPPSPAETDASDHQDPTAPPRPNVFDSLEGSSTPGPAAPAAPPAPAEIPIAPPAPAPLQDFAISPSSPVTEAPDLSSALASSPAEPTSVSESPPTPAPATGPETVEAQTAEAPEDAAEEVTPAAPPAKPAGSSQVQPPTDLDGPGMAFQKQTPAGEDPRHDEARRLARLLVSELKLYNEDEITRGRRLGNIYQSLREDIDRSKRIYDERVAADVRQSGDFLHEELVRGLADGDANLLGM